MSGSRRRVAGTIAISFVCCGVVGLGCDSDDAKGSRRYEAVSFPVDAIVQFLDRQK